MFMKLLFLATTLLSLLIFIFSDSPSAVAALPIVVVVVVALLPVLRRFSSYFWLCLAFSVAFLTDSEIMAWNEHAPLTEWIGTNVVFVGIHKLFAIPVLPPVSLFECALYALAISALVGHARSLGAERSVPVRTLLAAVLLWPVCLGVATIVGFFRGGEIGLALIQARSLGLIPAGAVVGYFLLDSEAKWRRLLALVAVVMGFKSLQGLYVYGVVYGGNMGAREFLMEHYSSEYLLASGAFLLACACDGRLAPRWRLGSLLLALTYVYPWFLNDRRASLVGAALSLPVLVAALPLRITKRLALPALAGGAFAALFLAATWDSGGGLGYFSRSLRSVFETPPAVVYDYRVVENFNLFRSVIEHPWLGLGLGQRVPFAWQTFDFRAAYAWFDVFMHNSFLGHWALGGPLLMGGAGVFFSFSALAFSRLVGEMRGFWRTALGILGLTMLVRWGAYTLFDIGFSDFRLIPLLGALLGVAVRANQEKPLPPTRQRELPGGPEKVAEAA